MDPLPLPLPARPVLALGIETQNRRRSIADAIEVLREKAGFGTYDQARIRVAAIRRPEALVGLVAVLYDPPNEALTYVVPLPSASRFCAIDFGGQESRQFRIEHLNSAHVFGDGSVVLRDGRSLRAVSVIPSTALTTEATELDWTIVSATIATREQPLRWLRYRWTGLPMTKRPRLPNIPGIDVATLPAMKLPPLKRLAREIAEFDPTLGRLSLRQIEASLGKFGMHLRKGANMTTRGSSPTVTR